SVSLLCEGCTAAIGLVSFLSECDSVLAVPPAPGKVWDLPTEVAKRIAEKCGKVDLSGEVKFSKEKKSIKTLSLQEKWQALEDADLTVTEKELWAKVGDGMKG